MVSYRFGTVSDFKTNLKPAYVFMDWLLSSECVCKLFFSE